MHFMPPIELLNFLEFQRYAIPVVVAVGLPLNALSFYLFWKSKLKTASSSRYLAAIAIADSGFLCSKLLSHLTEFKVNVYHIHGSCQMIMYVNHIATFLSIWYLTSLVMEKFIGLYWPKKKSRFCTVFRAKCVIISLGIMAIVFYHYITWTVGPSKDSSYCMPWPDNSLFEPWRKLNKVDTVLVAVIPHLSVLIMSCLISVRTCIYYRESHSAQHQLLLRRQRSCLPQEKEFKTTPLLLTVALVTVLIQMPNSYVRISEFNSDPLLGMIALFLQFTTYAIKSILYIFTSSQYRTEIWKLIVHIYNLCRRKDSQAAEMHNVSQQTDDNNGRIEISEGKV